MGYGCAESRYEAHALCFSQERMGLKFEIQYHEAVVSEDIPKLSSEWKDTIKNAIETKLVVRPEVFGKPLRYSLKGYRKLRGGDYRVVFRIEKTAVKILLIQHRSVAYKVLKKRV